MLLFWIPQRIMKKKSQFEQKYLAAQLFNTDNNQKCFLSSRMISEESCDTEAWSNKYILQRIHTENSSYLILIILLFLL